MNLKSLFVLLTLVILLITNCASPGETLKKENPKLYNDIIGKWYILSPNNPGEIIDTVSFNEDGTITGSFFGVFDKWSPEWTTNGSIRLVYNDRNRTICYNTEKAKNSLGKNSPYLKYKSLVNVMAFDHVTEIYDYYPENRIYVFVRDLNTIKILKQKIALEKETNYENFISKLDKNLNKGKLGGGYQNYKWGMTESDITTLLGKPKSKSSSADNNLTDLNYSLEDKEIQFTFYKEVLFEIVVKLNSDSGTIFKNLTDKYGKSKVTTSYDTNYMGAWKSKITYQDHNWSDGFTNIRVRYAKTSTICENCDNQYSYTPKLQEAWVDGVVYQSNVISNYLKKIANDEEKEEEIKKEKEVKDNL